MAAFGIFDRVQETSLTTGTGPLALGGAVSGFRAFSAVLSTGDTCWYTIFNSPSEWEVGVGTFTSPSTLARTTVKASSNAGSLVSFSAGTKSVFIDIPAYVLDALNLVEIDVASASTADIGTPQGAKIRITGTVTITSLGTAANKLRFVHFAGALTLTHSGTSLILPGAANITTAAGDCAVFKSDASGNWRCLDYERASGKALVGSASTDLTDSTSIGRTLLTAADATTARTAISAAQLSAMAAHNAVINGGISVSQELGTVGATLTNNTSKYTADMWEAMYNHGAATAVVISSQAGLSGIGVGLAGYAFGHYVQATTAISSPANGDFAKHRHKIEGYRIVPWAWGAAGASAIVVAFRFYSSVASGTAFVKLSNSDQSRCYYHEITVAAGWNFYAFTVAGDTSGTWQTTTSVGLTVEVFSSGKAASPASSLDAWGSTNTTQTTNSTNLLGTNGNFTIVTGLYVDAGTQLPVSADLPFLMRPFAEEIPLCQRYFEQVGGNATGKATSATNLEMTFGFKVLKRSTSHTIALITGLTSQVVDPGTATRNVTAIGSEFLAGRSGFYANSITSSGLTSGLLHFGVGIDWVNVSDRL